MKSIDEHVETSAIVEHCYRSTYCHWRGDRNAKWRSVSIDDFRRRGNHYPALFAGFNVK